MRRSLKVVLLAGIAALLCPAAAIASGPTSSPLPGYPRFRGVMLAHNDSSQSSDRERAIVSALKAASSTTPNCRLDENPGTSLCYWGGPVLRAHKVHLIFWEGTVAQGHPIGASYKEATEGYFENVAAASRTLSNVYAVGPQYGDSFSGPGEYSVGFGGPSTDVYEDKVNLLPAAGTTAGRCVDPATKNGICVTDKDIRTEIEAVRVIENAKSHHWESSLRDVYFLFTPPGVGGCFYGEGEGTSANACAFETYCAYHSSFENAGKEAEPPVYADVPDNANVLGCDSFEHPNGAEGVDATLGAASHEHNETITDPLEGGWFDLIGQEVADKCLPPETFDTYGGSLGGVPAEIGEEGGKVVVRRVGTLYNQLINGHPYYLQTEWSNSAGIWNDATQRFEGHCVQRMLPTSFTPPSEAKATVPAIFDGSASGEATDPVSYWVWSFGDGTQAETREARTAHSYAQAGTYSVTLTVFDAHGNSNSATTVVSVAPPPPAPEPIVFTRDVNVLVPVEPTAYTASQLASQLGLPANGARLSGLHPIAIGHAECPPACTVAVRMYALERVTVRGHRMVKRVFIGALTTKVASKRSSKLTLTLNATGRKLLRKSHRLSAQLLVSVTGKEGGSWQITRKVTLTR